MNRRKDIHFEISERKVLLRIFDALSVTLILYLIGEIFNFNYFDVSATNFYWIILLGIYTVIIGALFEMYNLQVASNQYQTIRGVILTSFTTVVLYLLTPVYSPILPSHRIEILFLFIAVFTALFSWRMVYVSFFASHRFHKRVVLVCDFEELDELTSALEKADPHYRVIGFVNSDTDVNVSRDKFSTKKIDVETLEEFVQNNSVSEIVVASQKTDVITVNLYNKLIGLLEKGFIIKEYTQVYESITQRIPVQYVSRDFYRYFPFNRSNQNHLYLLFVRFVEILISVIGLLIGCLLLPFVFIGNLLGNRGQLFYFQERVGQNGKVFTIVKLRTMIINAEKDGAVFATSNDSRITPFGKFLRKSRIDEFPQFVNILKGDMAVIGPRPERSVFVNEISGVMPFYLSRHVIKPGLTGWAQVNYSYGETIQDSLIKLQYDLYYIKHRSIFLDFNIIFKTISTVLFYRGQ